MSLKNHSDNNFKEDATWFIVNEVAKPISIDCVIQNFQSSPPVAKLIIAATQCASSFLKARLTLQNQDPSVNSNIKLINDAVWNSGYSIFLNILTEDACYYFWPKKEKSL